MKPGVRSVRVLSFAALFFAFAVSSAQQAPPSPHLAYVYPAGGQRGTTTEVKVGGQLLQGTTMVLISGSGVAVTIGEYFRPLTMAQANNMTQKLQEARQKLQQEGGRVGAGRIGQARVAQEAGISDEQLRLLELFRRERQDPKRQPNPQIAETVTLSLKIDPGATPGMREIRLLGPMGLTNPIRFEVGAWGDVIEAEPAEPTSLVARRAASDAASPREVQKIEAAMPFVINGRVLPGEVDRYLLPLKPGQKVEIAAKARALIPYIADAVPGWLQATLAVFDPSGKEVAFADHSLAFQDPVLRFSAQAAGDYTLAVRDGLYRGREDFVYRIAVGSPSQSPPSQGSESEPNNDFRTAQKAPADGVVAGVIGKPGDVDVYQLSGKAGQKLVAEVRARRMGSPLDSLVEVLSSDGKVVASNDDFNDPASALVTHQADSYVALTLPRTETYYVRVRDAQGQGSPSHEYRLRVGPPRPDFELRVVPSSLTARAGTAVAATVYAIRKDGFSGDIELSLEGGDGTVRLGGGTLPGGCDRVPITFSVPGTASAPVALKLTGHTASPKLAHIATPAEDMMQAFAYRHLVPHEQLLLSVIGQPNAGLTFVVPNKPVPLRLGQTCRFRLAGLGPFVLNRIRLALRDAPEGVTLKEVQVEADGLAVSLDVDSQKAKAGLRGNLLFDAFLEQPAPRGGGANRAAQARRAQAGQVPAIPFEIRKS